MLETPMKSSFITLVMYDQPTQEMIVQFKNGTREIYTGISEHLHDSFVGSESQGQFWNQNLKGKGTPYGSTAPENWMLYGSAIEDIKAGDRIEMDSATGRVRRAILKPLKP